MPIGKKTQTAPEIGDLVTAKAATTHIYEDSEGAVIKKTVPAATALGEIIMIAPNELGVDMYVVDSGAVFADEVTTAVNPLYNYGGDPAPKTTTDNSGGGFWGALNKILEAGAGLLTKKKTGTTTDTGTDDTVTTDETDTQKGSSNVVWYVVGGIAVVGGIVALAWPRGKKVEQAPQQPIIIKK